MHALECSLDSALLAILNHSRDCIAVIETDGALSFVNDNGLAGLGTDESVLGEPWHRLWSDESRADALDALSRALDGAHPRFEARCDTGATRLWDVSISPVRDRAGRITHVVSTARPDPDATARLEAAERDVEMQKAVAREAQHRLKNLITVVASIAKLVARRSTSLAEFERSFQRQLLNLDRAQGLLTDGAENSGTLGQVVSVVLEGEGRDPRLTVSPLPTGLIGDRSVQLLALVLGELRTNAIKHGALSVDEGRITLDLRSERDDLHIVWDEDIGRTAPDPGLSGGSGLDLIRRMLSATGAEPEIGWTGRGLRMAFTASRF